MKLTISVVIPVYNGELFIADALDSVARQTCPAAEVIVVDDGSTDRTPEILNKYRGRISVIRIPNSGGCSVPRNVGIRAARGDFIALMDADDLWYNRKLESQLRAIERFPGVDFFCTDFFTRHDAGTLLRHFASRRFGSEIRAGSIAFDRPFDAFPLLVSRNFVGCPSSVLFSRALAQRTGYFNPAYTACEDLDYWIRCSLQTQFVILSEPLVYKRRHERNMTANQRNILLNRAKVIAALYSSHGQILRKRGLAPSCRRVLARINLALARQQGSGEWGEKIRFFWQAVQSDPSILIRGRSERGHP